MRRKRVTGRFYVFLALVLVGGFFILRELMPGTAQEATVAQANASYTYEMDAVVMRKEVVTSLEGGGRVVFVAAEGQKVSEGDLICEVFSAGYSDKELTKLEDVRRSIGVYHQTIWSTIKNESFDRIEQRVRSRAHELKTLVRTKTGGSLLNLVKQLEDSMLERQQYMNQNQRHDQKLNQLYREEEQRKNAIQSWKRDQLAPISGIVSFYVDGFEEYITADKPLSDFTVADINSIMLGKLPTKTVSSRLKSAIFRVVSTDKWFVILRSKENWNTVTGQQVNFKIQGFDDVLYTGTVMQSQKVDGEVMVQLEIAGSLGPLMNHRSGKAMIAGNVMGLAIPEKAIVTQNDQTGVLKSDLMSGTFVPVTILSREGGYVLVQPLVEGTLKVADRVLMK